MGSGWPPKFRLDQERVLRLFIGDAFYSNVDAGLREALLNAIDACSRRASSQPGIEPEIRLTFDRDQLTITLEDNGDGMGTLELTELFAKVGASASELAGREQSSAQSLIGTFGIGVVSYFLLCDEYEVHTLRQGGEPLRLAFSVAMLDGETEAGELPASRSAVGTSLLLRIKDVNRFDVCLQRYEHWARDVEGLSAILNPEGRDVPQGGLAREVTAVTVEAPDWVETAHIGPPTQFTVWDSFDGSAVVDVLYRGVFVDNVVIDGLWSIAGTVHVDPKHFRPRLNREGFVGDEMRTELGAFLKEAHPAVLIAALDVLKGGELKAGTSSWTLSRWASLWLALPRDEHYRSATELWDEEFRSRPAYRLLQAGEGDSQTVSIADIQSLNVSRVFVAPVDLRAAGDVIRQAARALVARGEIVLQGVERDSSYLSGAPLVSTVTSDLLLSYFKEDLPELVVLADAMAHDLVKQESLLDLFHQPIVVRVVNLGSDGSAVAVVAGEIWINLDSEAGRNVLSGVADRNEGLLGLWVACLLFAPASVQEVASIIRSPKPGPRLGPVMRQTIRRLLQ